MIESDDKNHEEGLNMAKKELSLEEYARFLAFSGPKSEEEFIKRLKKRGIQITP